MVRFSDVEEDGRVVNQEGMRKALAFKKQRLPLARHAWYVVPFKSKDCKLEGILWHHYYYYH